MKKKKIVGVRMGSFDFLFSNSPEIQRLKHREKLAIKVLRQISVLPRQAKARRLANGVLNLLEATD